MEYTPRLRRVRFVVSLMLAMMFSFTLPANAQVVGATVTGSVVDQQGGLAVSNARVTLETDTVVASTTTANDGQFIFTNVPPGVYSITVAAPAYQTTRSTDVVVTAAGETVTTAFAVL